MMNLCINLKRIAFAFSLLSGSVFTASAQLVFGSTTTTTTNPSAIYLDVNTGQTTTLWNSATNKKVNGLAADEIGGRLYSNDAARLNFWDYGSIGIAPTFIAGMFRSNGTTTSATGFDGLAWANGALYGSTSFPSTTFTRGRTLLLAPRLIGLLALWPNAIRLRPTGRSSRWATIYAGARTRFI